MVNLFRATIALTSFVFFFPNAPTRLDEVLGDLYPEIVGDGVLAIGTLSVVFALASVVDAGKAVVQKLKK